MNKDVIYIEPEDDITDVISRLKNSKQRVVALVPPKKLGILRSAINIKLLARAAKQADKVVVLVTNDASVIKLAATVSLPIAKTLQSRPVIPKLTPKEAPVEKDVETIEGDDAEDDDEEEVKKPKKSLRSEDDEKADAAVKALKEDDEMRLNSSDVEEDEPKAKSDKKLPNFDRYRKFIVAGAAVLVALVGFLVWAIGFSGAADIIVKIRTSSSSFAETVSLVTSESAADLASGKLLLEKVEFEKESSTEFEATGEKDFGNKASGTLTIQASSRNEFTAAIPAGTEFYVGGLTFVAASDSSISWDGRLFSCEHVSYVDNQCVTSISLEVVAAEGGTKYNIAASQSDWTAGITTIPGFHASNATAFTGGTSEIAKVVSREDVEKAKSSLGNTTDEKESFLSSIDKEQAVIIDASFKSSTADPTPSVAIGEKAEKATLTAKTTYTVFVVSRESINEFIKTSVGSSLGADQAVYDVGSPFIERFVETQDKKGYTAKLKSTLKSGPEVTEKDILEKARGKKIGEVQSLLQSINGVSSVSVKTPYPWVRSVPDDDSKVTVKIEVEE